MFLIVLCAAIKKSVAATTTWIAEGDGIRLEDRQNWVGRVPITGDTALFTSSFGSGGTIRFTDGSPYTANLSTLTSNSVPTQYKNFNAGTASSSVATINFGSSTSNFTYSFTDPYADPNFYIGASRATTGTVITSVGGLLNFRTRFGQGVRLYSTIVGTGSINIGSFGAAYQPPGYTPLGAALVLGAGDQANDGSLNTNNTFTGGVTLEGFGLLGLGESSVFSGSIVSGPIGTGTLTINGGRIAAFRCGTLSPGMRRGWHRSRRCLGFSVA